MSSDEKLAEHPSGFFAELRISWKSRVHRERCVDGSHALPAVEIRRRIDGSVVLQAE
jgi:hypothetical protein